LKLSGLPHHKTLDEFDASFQPELDPKRLAELRSLRFVQNKVSSLFLGPPGVGETHLAVGLAMEALRAGYLVRYTTLDDVVRELRQADQLGTLRNRLSHYQRPHVLIVDQVGYMRLEHGDANRFFQLINRRYTRSSMIVTSNKRVSEWAELFGDEVQAVAILDRLLHDAEISHQRPVLAAPRPRRPPQPAVRQRPERRKQPDRYPSPTTPRAGERLTRSRPSNPRPSTARNRARSAPQAPPSARHQPLTTPHTSPPTDISRRRSTDILRWRLTALRATGVIRRRDGDTDRPRRRAGSHIRRRLWAEVAADRYRRGAADHRIPSGSPAVPK
jgi:hypothetical protein